MLIGAAMLGVASRQSAGQHVMHLRVIATHDFHGALEPTTYSWSNGRLVGGAAALSAAVDSARARCHCPTLFLDAGDEMQGTLESNLVYGRSDIRAFNLMGLDAAAVGNHELDWGADTLRAREAESHYPWLAANVFLHGTNRHPSWAKPYEIINKHGIRIGVIGYLTSDTPITQPADRTAGLDFVRGLPGIADALNAVRAQHPDFVIITAHAGGDCSGGTCKGEMVDVARALDSAGVDLIVGGHFHTPGSAVVNGIPIVRAGWSGQAISVVDLSGTDNGPHQFALERDTVWDDQYTPSQAINAVLRPYRAIADSVAHQPITRFARRVLEHDLGVPIAAALREAVHADVGMENRGGVRTDIDSGVVTYGDVFRVLPFDNAIVKVTLTGRQLHDALDSILTAQPEYFSGIRVAYDSTAGPGHRVQSMTFAGGQPIPPDTMLTVALPDFVVDSPPGATVFAPYNKDRTSLTLRDAFVAALKRGQP